MIAGGTCLVYCVVEVLLGVWWHVVRTSTTDVCCNMKTLSASSCQHLRLCRSAFPSSLTTSFKWMWRRRCGVNTSWILVSFEVVLYSVDLAWAACALFMAALRSRYGHYIFALLFLSVYFFYSLPNLSGCRLDVYHTSTHDIALVWI